MLFDDRRAAGRELARRLKGYAGRGDTLVLALPRGGVPVAFEVARALGAPLDVFLVRKLGAPGRPELAMGAIASGGIRVLNSSVVTALGIEEEEIEAVAHDEQVELDRQERLYRRNRPRLDVKNRTAILIDDGLATGASMRAAVEALRQQGAARIVTAVPVGSVDTCADFKAVADEAICVRTPEPFYSVGQWYTDFSQTSDEEVQRLLAEAESAQQSIGEPQATAH